MARTNLNKVTTRSNEPNLNELRAMYRNNVCNKISENALSLFSENELKRHIGKCLYDRFIFPTGRNRTRIVDQIARLLFVHPNTVKNWCPVLKNHKRAKKKSSFDSGIKLNGND